MSGLMRGSNQPALRSSSTLSPLPLLGLGTMTLDDEARMAELLKLIAHERDPRRVVTLAKELERLLESEPEPREEPRGS